MSLTCQEIVGVAASTNAAMLGAGVAGRNFARDIKQAISIHRLTKQELDELNIYVEDRVTFTQTMPGLNDHAVLASMRIILRAITNKFADPATMQTDVLIIGATTRELQMYERNPNASFLFYGREAKDGQRMGSLLRGTLGKLLSKVKKRRGKKHNKDVNAADNWQSIGELCDDHKGPKMVCVKRDNKSRTVELNDELQERLRDYIKEDGHTTMARVTRYVGLCAMLRTLSDGCEFRHRIYQDDDPLPKVSHLLFPDSITSISEHDICAYFAKTGAVSGSGIAFLPWELIWPGATSHNLYTFGRHRNQSKKVMVGFRGSNGYLHDEDTWAQLLKKTHFSAVLDKRSHQPWRKAFGIENRMEVHLYVELTHNIGAMYHFSLTRVDGPKTDMVVRHLVLPEHLQYVDVLDVVGMAQEHPRIFDNTHDFSLIPLMYKSFPKHVWYAMVNYFATLKKKDVIRQNAAIYCRNASGGITSNGKIHARAWAIKEEDFETLNLAVTMETLRVQQVRDLSTKSVDLAPGLLQPIKRALKSFMLWITLSKKHHPIVKIPRMAHWVVDEFKNIRDTGTNLVFVNAIEQEELVDGKKVVPCELCKELHEVDGCEFECNGRATAFRPQLTLQQVTELRGRMDNEEDPKALRDLILAARKKVPRDAFIGDGLVIFENLKGGPGGGKTHNAQQIAKSNDAVLVPLRSLIADWTQNSAVRKDQIRTPHHAIISGLVGDTLWVDEYTAVDYALLMVICYLYSPRRVVLLGDESQCGIRSENGEGMSCVTQFIRNAKYPPRIHNLTKNWRNPAPIVCWLNSEHEYRMTAVKPIADDKKAECSVVSVSTIEFEQIRKTVNIDLITAPSSMTAGDASGGRTVRAIQGASQDRVGLLISTPADARLLQISALQIVAMSRHKIMLYLIHPGNKGEAQLYCDHMEKTFIGFVGEDPANYIAAVEVVPDEKEEEEEEDFNEIQKEQLEIVRQHNLSCRIRNFFVGPLPPDYASLAHERNNVHPENFQKKMDHGIICLIFGNAKRARENGHIHTLNYRKGAPLREVMDILHATGYMSGRITAHGITRKALTTWVSTDATGWKKYEGRYAAVNDTVNYLGRPTPATNLPSPHFFTSSITSNADMTGDYLFFLPGGLKGGAKLPFRDPIEDQFNDVKTKFIKPNGVTSSLDTVVAEVKHGGEYTLLCGADAPELEPDFLEHMFMNTGVPVAVYKKAPVQIEYILRESTLPPQDNAVNAAVEVLLSSDEKVVENNPNEAASHIDHGSGRLILDPNHGIGPQAKPTYALAGGRGSHTTTSVQHVGNCAEKRYSQQGGQLRVMTPAQAVVVQDILQEGYRELFLHEMPSTNTVSGMEQEGIRLMRDAISRGYGPRFAASAGLWVPNTIFAFVKNQFKYASEPNHSKVGQGISPMHVSLATLFLSMSRHAGDLFRSALAPHVLLEHRLTEKEFLEQAQALFATIDNSALIGYTDASEFDAKQNVVTQAIERGVLSKLGLSEGYLDAYYALRHGAIMIFTGVAKCQLGYEKISGEVKTLLTNTIVNLFYANYLVRGKGPFTILAKGDDFTKKQVALKICPTRRHRLMATVNLPLKSKIARVVPFCAYMVGSDNITPHIVRKAQKLLGYRFSSLEHLAAYRASALDTFFLLTSYRFGDLAAAVIDEASERGVEISARQAAVIVTVCLQLIETIGTATMQFLSSQLFIVTCNGYVNNAKFETLNMGKDSANLARVRDLEEALEALKNGVFASRVSRM